MIRIVGRDDFAEALEVGLGLLLHEIALVGQRPPDVAERREPRDDVAQIRVVRRGGHAVETPVARVVGMKQDQVRLDAELLQVEDAPLEVPEEFRIGSREIPRARRACPANG